LKRLERLGLGLALTEWGLHECQGRLRDQLGGQVSAPADALAILLQVRAPLVAELLAAEPVETWRIELDPADIPDLHTLEHPIDGHSRAMVGAVGPGGDHVRHLIESRTIGGPILATAEVNDTQVHFIDGLHRMWAWTELARQGRTATVQASLVLTERLSWWAKMRRQTSRG
jgi:hypothetical protein